MKMQRRQFRIGELAQHLNLEKFVIRFWEKEFGIKTTRSAGGQRFYQEKDLETFKKIKTLLYDRGFTINGAKKILNKKNTEITVVGSQKTSMQSENKQPSKEIEKELMTLRKKLHKLKELL